MKFASVLATPFWLGYLTTLFQLRINLMYRSGIEDFGDSDLRIFLKFMQHVIC
jgi:hypothetical protein